MPDPYAAAIAANRFGLGARGSELRRIADDPRGWLVAQLDGAAPPLHDKELRSSTEILAATLELRLNRQNARAAADEQSGSADASDAPGAAARDALELAGAFRRIYAAEVDARLGAAVATDRPFLERLTHLWTNHFAVSVDKLAVLGLAGAFEREAIRPHVLGRFGDLLLAAERHPAMLIYLDNHLSVGPGSTAARIVARRGGRQVGINENLAREILELHTLGVDGGYAQRDVTELAKVLTGWSIRGDAARGAGRVAVRGRGPSRAVPGNPSRVRGEPGELVFRAELHEPGAKEILGKRYADGGESQGAAVLRDLAAQPATARFVATKLARHFIADEPPPGAVDRIAAAFLDGGGDLRRVYRALVESPEAWERPLTKYKTPSEYVVSTFRGLDLPVDAGRGARSFAVLGQPTYAPGSPAGWPDVGADWDGASALMTRIEWADALGQRVGERYDPAELAGQLLGDVASAATLAAIAGAASAPQALTLLLTAPEFLRR